MSDKEKEKKFHNDNVFDKEKDYTFTFKESKNEEKFNNKKSKIKNYNLNELNPVNVNSNNLNLSGNSNNFSNSPNHFGGGGNRNYGTMIYLNEDTSKSNHINTTDESNSSVSTNSLRDSIKNLNVLPNNNFNFISNNSPKSQPIFVIKYHLDSVRDLSLIKSKTISETTSILASGGDDYTLNVWKINHLENIKEIREPLFTLRAHSCPIFSMESGRENKLFTGDLKGNISIIDFDEEVFNLNPYYSYNDLERIKIKKVRAFKDIVWSMKRFNDKLAAVSSDKTMKIICTNTNEICKKSFFNYFK